MNAEDYQVQRRRGAQMYTSLDEVDRVLPDFLSFNEVWSCMEALRRCIQTETETIRVMVDLWRHQRKGVYRDVVLMAAKNRHDARTALKKLDRSEWTPRRFR